MGEGFRILVFFFHLLAVDLSGVRGNIISGVLHVDPTLLLDTHEVHETLVKTTVQVLTDDHLISLFN